jgi:putative hydrolase of the HAD superfamily
MIRALLLDLGNVVLEVDFRRTFRRWAESAGVDVAHFHANWSLDEAYEAHERGHIAFEEYIESLATSLEVRMPLSDWKAGWNDLFVGPFDEVQHRLEALEGSMPLYAFTNTNRTHEVAWRERFPEALTSFDEIFVSSTIGMRKPDREAYEWVAGAMDLAPQEILFLDDNLDNIHGAKATGLEVEWIRSPADVVDVLSRF